MSPQTETKASVGFKAGVKEYKLTYYTPEYETNPTARDSEFQIKDVGDAYRIGNCFGVFVFLEDLEKSFFFTSF
jgi:hypothetical protein